MKKYFKKSLSLMMAALMLLSCWVFVAPTKAEAVDSGTYHVQVVVSSNNDTGGWDYGRCTLKGKDKNGKGTESQIWYGGDNKINFNGDRTWYDGYTDKFPTSVSYAYSFGGGITHRKMDAYIKIVVNGTEILSVRSYSYEWGNNKGTKSGSVASGSYPKASSVVFDQAPGAVTVPKTGTATTSMQTHLNDQYGVRVSSSASTYSKTYSLSSNRSSTTGVSCAAGTTTTTYDPWTLSVTNSAKLTGYDTNTISATVSYTFNGATVSAYKTFVVTDPKYTFSFNTNGGNSISPNTAITKYYYNKLTSAEIPSSGVRPGYEFIAMYGDAKLNYDVTKPTPGSTTGFTGQLTNTTPIGGDKTWYAAWWAKDVTVTLVDNMDNVLKTFKSKYDKKAAFLDSDWPTDVEFKSNKPTGTFDYVFTGWKVDVAKQYNADGTQSELQGAYGTSSDEFILKGDTVFKAQFSKKKNSYNVKFYGETGNTLSDTNYVYRDQPQQPATSKATDNYFTYTFKGWHRVLDGEQKTGYIVNKDGYLSTSATSDAADLVDGKKVLVGLADDFTVRSDAEYVPVFEKTYNEYTVTFKYKSALGVDLTSNNEGKTYHFGDALNLPEVTDSYTTGGYRYPLVNWTKNNAATGSTVLPATLDASVTTHATRNVTYVAVYGSGVPAEYNVTFTYIQADGTETTDAYVINHNDPVTAPAGVPQTYRDDDYEYTFAGWADVNDNNKPLESPAYKDAEYVAQYTSKKLYTVSFMNEGVEFGESAKYVAGQTIALPAETPTKAADKSAWQYTFDKWVDENGTAVTVMPENDLVLTAEYIPSYIEYTIKFVWKDTAGNDVTDSKTYHYKDLIEIPSLEELDQKQYKDDTYTYTFKAWDKDVSARCLGDGEMAEDGKTGTLTYTATYRREYNYYTVRWMQESGQVDGNPVYSENAYSTDAYIYNEKVRIPVPPEPAYQPDDTAYSRVLDHWAYKDENGNFVAIDRDTKITGNMTFYPIYEEAAKVCTVNLYNETGTQLIQVLKVPYMTNLEEYSGLSLPRKPYTDDMHYRFNGWVDATTKDPVTIIYDDCNLWATYVQEAHTYGEVVADKEPTFFETGLGTKTCTECAKAVSKIEIARVPDTTAPTAKLFVKDAVTVSGGEVPTEAILVAPKNNLVVATLDSAEASKYNEAGKGIGTGRIEYYVSLGTDAVDFASITEWKLRFDYDAYVQALRDRGLTDEEVALEMSEFQANATAYVGDLANTYPDIVTDGSTFIFYIKVSDRKGNASYVRSQPLTYDATTPVITITGNGNGGSKFCVEATATITENVKLASVTVNGEKKTLTDGKLTISGKGLYQIAATDVAGNVTEKNIEIIGGHNEKATVTAPTCTDDGGATYTCTVCGIATNEPLVTEKLGHDYRFVKKVNVTCIDDGYELYRCTRCGVTEKRNIEAASGAHTYGEYVVTKNANCSNEGLKYRVCSVCGDQEIVAIPVDSSVHVWYRGVVTKPTCTNGGYTMHTCKYCGVTEKVEGSDVEALKHEASGVWVVTAEASCDGYDEETKTGGTVGERVQYCVRDGAADCNKVVMKTEEIPVPGHVWEVKAVVDPTETAEGYTLRACKNCGLEKRTDYVPVLEKHTVTFNVDGAEYEKLEGYVGDSVTVSEPTKATDATFRYTFVRWEDADGNKVALPYTVGNADVTFTAVFEKTYLNYTFIFYSEADKQFKKVGYLHYDDPAQEFAGPSDYEDETSVYKFVGWLAKNDTTGKPSKSIKVSEVNFDGNRTAEFVAKFEKITKKVNFTYAYDFSNIIYTTKVDCGTVVDVNKLIPAEKLAKVTKDFDNAFHYQFSEWAVRDGASSVNPLVADGLAIAKFSAIEHTLVDDEEKAADNKAATCTEEGVAYKKCSGCGYTVTETLPALGHSWGPDSEGKQECTRPDCGEVKESDTRYVVKFFVDEEVIRTVSDIKYGADITSRIPTATKADNGADTYVFTHWSKKGDTAPVDLKTALKKVTADAEYVAVFKTETRKCKVIFRVDGSTEALQIVEVAYGTKELPKYTGIAPTSARVDAYTHDKWSGDWDKEASDFPNGITEDVVLNAVFVGEDHNFKSVARANATCTEAGWDKYECTVCKYSYTKTIGKPLGHEFTELVERVEPEGEKAGHVTYKCVRCDETITKEIAANQYFNFTVSVIDSKGNPIEGAKVTIFDGDKFVDSGYTNADGKVTFKVESAKKYRVVVEGANFDTTYGDITVNDDGTTSGELPKINVKVCSCTCHRDGLWPTIFRFFHKIIKMLTGNFGCCGDPDPRYNK